MKKLILCVLSSLMIVMASCRKDPAIPTGMIFNPTDNPTDDPTDNDTVEWTEGTLPGLFSVSDDVQIQFSQGNLQYKASTDTWRFAERQWDVIGDDNCYISQGYQGWIDLFGWGTSGYDHGAVCYQPWSTSTENSDYYAYGQEDYNLYDQSGQADWGYNAISNGGNQVNQWRTLTHEEWEYIFNTRITSSGIRYAKAIVDGVNGVILLPDNWSSSFFVLNDTDTYDAVFSSNILLPSEWNVLEQHGAVFLPAAGYRVGTSVNFVGSDGIYWSATYDNSNFARGVYFNDLVLSAGNYINRYYGQSVRLVRSLQNNSFFINANPNPAEGGTVSGGGTYEWGTECTLTATANEGFVFANWTSLDYGVVVSWDAEYTFMVTESWDLVANFIQVDNEPVVALHGLFSVSDDQQVCFSKGNLQYRASTRTWRFAPNQYDRIGEDNGNISVGYNGWIDLFGWGTSGYDHGAECYQPWSVSNNSSYYYVYGSSSYNLYDQSGQADWGYAVGVQEGDASNNGWRTLTNEEWQYLFEERTTESDIRYAAAEVKGVNGTILLPDNWRTSYYDLDPWGGYSSNIINASQWSVLEQFGAVFLPAAGHRDETSVQYVGYSGCYWSSTRADSYQAYYVSLQNGYVGVGGYTNQRSGGLSVRLVLSPQESSYGFINVTSNPLGCGAVAGGGAYPLNAECTLTATANMGFGFASWTENGAIVSTDATYTFTVTGSRNLVANFVLSGDDANGILDGLFSVDDDRQVQFSKGNLQYQASTNTWRFAEHQWDMVGEDNANIGQGYDGWIDLFGWGTSGWNNGNTYYQPWDYNNSNGALYGPVGKYDLDGNYENADWGVYNAISNGGNQPGVWHTMSRKEWNYLLFTRATVSGIRFAKAQVNGVNGLILLPDVWNASDFPLNSTNSPTAKFDSNAISLAQWNNMEHYGAVFLPASGYRNGNTIYNVGSYSSYWTSWFYTDNSAYSMACSNIMLNTTNSLRHYGCPIRLVYSRQPVPQEHLLEVTTTEITNITSTAATCKGNVVAEDVHFVLECGICWGLAADPTVAGNHSAMSGVVGGFGKRLTDLNPGETYHVRAYAKNNQGVFYGEDKTFSTEMIVTTTEPTTITAVSAILRGNVSSSGTLIERGCCWSLSPVPTIEGDHLAASSSVSGSFNVKATNLSPGTTYYVRAYASNNNGIQYGNEVVFVTRAEVTTADPYNITATSAVCGGVVVSDETTVMEKGICWSTSAISPTIGGSHLAYSTVGAGGFTLTVTGLEPETTYHVRAYATNNSGTSYGETKTFTTLSRTP